MRMQLHKCLKCGETCDSATPINRQEYPYAGDITICLYCGHMMAFNDDLSIRNLTEEEARLIADDPVITRIQEIRNEVLKVKREGLFKRFNGG